MKQHYVLLILLLVSINVCAQEPFITTWEVQAGDLDITIPVIPAEYTYDYTVNFGDGTVMNNVASSVSHTYASAGIYTIEITGIFPAIRIYDLNDNDKFKLKSIEQWGDISWQTMNRAFNDAYNLVINATDAPDLSQVTDMSYMFVDTWNFNQSINHWDVSNVEDMGWLFSGAISFNQPLDNWNVSSVTNMFRMFYGAVSFNQPINDWNVSNVTNMESMFQKDENTPYNEPGPIFNQSLNNWDVSNVTNISRMFAFTESFNQPLDSWDVSSVIWMDEMFLAAKAFNQSLNSWDTSNVSSMDRIFQAAIVFNGEINNWDVSNVTDFSYVFAAAYAFNQPLDNWNVSSATNMDHMFRNADSFNQPLNSWDVSNVTDMSDMFRDTSSFNQPLDNWDVTSVENMTYMFSGATAFNNSINNWNLSSIQNSGLMDMFNGATSFNQPLDGWNMSNITRIPYLFRNATAFNQPLDSWDVSNITYMFGLFDGATSFNQPLDSWDVSNVYRMSYMFKDASSFNQPLNNWDVSGIEHMSNMFNGASSFNQQLNNWDVSNVVSMASMFKGASSFNQDLSSWDVSSNRFFSGMFEGATSFNQNLNTWNFSSMETTLTQNGLTDFLNFTDLSLENYDALLQHLTTFNLNNVNLGADGLEYCNTTAVDYLINQLNWTISGHSLGLCNTISGVVYLDSDSNGCDNLDVEVSNYFVFLENTDNQNVYAIQVTDAMYSGGVSGTNFTATIEGLPDYMTASPVDAIVNFSGGSTEETQDFCITASQAIEDLSITLIPTSEARPGFESTYQLIVENLGTEPISNVEISFSFDDAMQSFVSAEPTPDMSNSDSLQFNFASFEPFQSETIDITMQIFTPPTVNGNDILNFVATVLPDTNDYSPDNNTYNLEQVVINSYDPNDITVLQGATITPDQTGDYLDYVIRFQNTGTASAINVEVQSLLHQNLDASTFRILSASHNYDASIENNIIIFDFDDIYLPDETSDPEGSNGFVAYRIKPKSDIQIGEVMEGIAGIYFDFNPPIITNLVSTEVVNPLGVDDYNLNSLLSIYPNPTDNGIHLNIMEGLTIESIQLYDISGSQLLNIDGFVDYIGAEQIESGIYHLIVNSNRGQLVRKLIIN